MAVAGRCSSQAVSVDAVQCCGFAGERGFMRPELNEYALRQLKAGLPDNCTMGYSTSRTCEIGLSEMADMPYQSLLYLVAVSYTHLDVYKRQRPHRVDGFKTVPGLEQPFPTLHLAPQ